MYAYRVGRACNIRDSTRDDGEHGSGRAILDILKEKNLRNVIVIVTRYLGEHLGPARFDEFKQCAKDAVEMLDMF